MIDMFRYYIRNGRIYKFNKIGKRFFRDTKELDAYLSEIRMKFLNKRYPEIKFENEAELDKFCSIHADYVNIPENKLGHYLTVYNIKLGNRIMKRLEISPEWIRNLASEPEREIS
jgi:hypothetical protein